MFPVQTVKPKGKFHQTFPGNAVILSTWTVLKFPSCSLSKCHRLLPVTALQRFRFGGIITLLRFWSGSLTINMGSQNHALFFFLSSSFSLLISFSPLRFRRPFTGKIAGDNFNRRGNFTLFLLRFSLSKVRFLSFLYLFFF